MPNIWHIWHTKHKNGALSDVLNLKNYATLLQYSLKYETVRTTMAKYILLFYSHFLSPHHKYLSLRLLIFVFSLISIFSICLPQHADHQRPPLNAADLTKDHHSSPPTIYLLYSALGSFFSFFRSRFLAEVWWVGLDGQIGGGWVRVVGYGGGWVEMVMGGSVMVGGSAGDGQISDGESVVVPIPVLIFFCSFYVLVVLIWWWIQRRLWVDFGGCGFFFFL